MKKFIVSWPTAAVVIAGIAACVVAAALGVSTEVVTLLGAIATVAGGMSHAMVKRDPESTERADDEPTPRP